MLLAQLRAVAPLCSPLRSRMSVRQLHLRHRFLFLFDLRLDLCAHRIGHRARLLVEHLTETVFLPGTDVHGGEGDSSRRPKALRGNDTSLV